MLQPHPGRQREIQLRLRAVRLRADVRLRAETTGTGSRELTSTPQRRARERRCGVKSSRGRALPKIPTRV